MSKYALHKSVCNSVVFNSHRSMHR